MADSAVAITAGSGTSIDTRTEGTNGNHRQVIVIGDPATNAGVAPVDATNGLAVDVKASALPTGAATSAKQDTIIGHVDGIETLLGTIDADTSNITTKIDTVATNSTTLAGAVSGTEMQVDIVSAPTLTVNAHAVTNAGTFAVQVDGSALTSLQLIDDAVYTDGTGTVTKGIAMLGQDGTNPQAIKTDSSGELQVDVLTMPTTTVQATNLDIRDLTNADVVTAELSAVDNAVLDDIAADTEAIKNSLAGTLTVTGGGGGIQYTEADIDASITGTAILWEDTSDTLRAVSAAKPLPVDIQDATIAVTQSGTWDEVGINDSGNSITVDNGGTFVVQENGAALTALQLIDDGVATVASAITTKGMAAVGTDGTNARILKTDTSGELQVDVLTMPTTTVTGTVTANLAAGTNNIGDVDILSIAAGDNNIGNVDIVTMPNVTLAAGTNTNEVVGDVAHDAAAAGNPLRIGAKAETSLSGLTLVADGDATDLFAGVDGVLITRPHSNLEDLVSGNASNTDGTSTQVIAASGAGVKTYITDVTISNTSSSNIYVELKDGSTAKWTFPVPANAGVTHSFTTPIGGTANTAWNFDPSAAATTVYCSAAGFKSKI